MSVDLSLMTNSQALELLRRNLRDRVKGEPGAASVMLSDDLAFCLSRFLDNGPVDAIDLLRICQALAIDLADLTEPRDDIAMSTANLIIRHDDRAMAGLTNFVATSRLRRSV